MSKNNFNRTNHILFVDETNFFLNRFEKICLNYLVTFFLF